MNTFEAIKVRRSIGYFDSDHNDDSGAMIVGGFLKEIRVHGEISVGEFKCS
jgi:hypothetical protein